MRHFLANKDPIDDATPVLSLLAMMIDILADGKRVEVDFTGDGMSGICYLLMLAHNTIEDLLALNESKEATDTGASDGTSEKDAKP